MKRTTILFALLLAGTCGFAQKGKVTSALSYKETGKLDKAVEAIEETIDPKNPKSEGSITWPRTWEVRGEIYQAIFQSKDENYKKLCAEPLTVAYDSYMKALQLDDKDKFSKSVKTLIPIKSVYSSIEFLSPFIFVLRYKLSGFLTLVLVTYIGVYLRLSESLFLANSISIPLATTDIFFSCFL